MNMEAKILLAGLVAVWGASVVVVARRSHFKTFIKYIDALVFLPLLAVLIPPSVYFVDRLSPVVFDLFDLLKGVKSGQVMPVLEPYRWTLSNLLALALVAVVPAVIFFGWRRMLSHREEAILSRRAAA
jgi:hypothetical protein